MVDGPDRTDTPATVLRAGPPALLEDTWGEDRQLRESYAREFSA